MKPPCSTSAACGFLFLYERALVNMLTWSTNLYRLGNSKPCRFR